MMSNLRGFITRLRSPTGAMDRRPRFCVSDVAIPFGLICTSLISYGMSQGAVRARELELPLNTVSITTPALLDVIIQNTPGYSTGYPLGVPRTYAWCNGAYKPAEHIAPPADFTAVTGWGRIYPKWERGSQNSTPASPNADATVAIANAKTYVRLSATKEWVLVQDQDENEIAGAHFVADFGPKAGLDAKLSTLPDASVTIDSPPIGYNNVFWVIKRGTFAAGSVDGVYVQVDMKTNDPNMRLVANVGADWWRNENAEYERGFVNNKGVGASNWIELSDQWSTLFFYSGSTSRFEADLPPPLVNADRGEAPIAMQRHTGAPTPCLRPVDRQSQ